MASLFRAPEAANLALHALALLAQRPGELVSTRELAGTLQASGAHLAKVLNLLEHNALVAATRGPAGGYRLARPAERITLKEIYEAIEGPQHAGNCIFSVPVCGGASCPLSAFFGQLNRQALRKLGRTRLSEMHLARPAARRKSTRRKA